MKLISKSVVDINFSIPNFLNEKGYSQNFDYICYRYDGDLPVDVYVLFTNDNYFILLYRRKHFTYLSKHW